ncbi:MAG: biliverdin-producing heme oxygenase [Parvularcula sp.]|nr:biliverdin-producing heme oxygenase [Parvularcula sp.]
MRFRLRKATRDDHDRVDAAFAIFDLSTPAGLTAYLRAHHAALCALEPHFSACPGVPALTPRLPLIQRDLAVLGASALPSPPSRTFHGSPLGQAYVFAGSHLGGKILNAQRMQSQSREVQRAGAYMGAEDMASFWDNVLERIAAEGEGEDAFEAMLLGARDGFQLFIEAIAYVRSEDGRRRAEW